MYKFENKTLIIWKVKSQNKQHNQLYIIRSTCDLSFKKIYKTHSQFNTNRTYTIHLIRPIQNSRSSTNFPIRQHWPPVLAWDGRTQNCVYDFLFNLNSVFMWIVVEWNHVLYILLYRSTSSVPHFPFLMRKRVLPSLLSAYAWSHYTYIFPCLVFLVTL